MKKSDTPLDWLNKGSRNEKEIFVCNYILSGRLYNVEPDIVSLAKQNKALEILNIWLSEIPPTGQLIFNRIRRDWNKKKHDSKNKVKRKKVANISDLSENMLKEIAALKGKSVKETLEDLIHIAYSQKNIPVPEMNVADAIYSPVSKMNQEISLLFNENLFLRNQNTYIKNNLLASIKEMLRENSEYQAVKAEILEDKIKDILNKNIKDIDVIFRARFAAICKSVNEEAGSFKNPAVIHPPRQIF